MSATTNKTEKTMNMKIAREAAERFVKDRAAEVEAGMNSLELASFARDLLQKENDEALGRLLAVNWRSWSSVLTGSFTPVLFTSRKRNAARLLGPRRVRYFLSEGRDYWLCFLTNSTRGVGSGRECGW